MQAADLFHVYRAPIDDNDDFVVDALDEAYLVLRQVSNGETQIIQLASLAPMVEPVGRPADRPQD